MRISDWSSDVCSSDLEHGMVLGALLLEGFAIGDSSRIASIPALPYIEMLCNYFAEGLQQYKIREWKRQMHVTVLQRPHPTHTLQMLSEAMLDIVRPVQSVETWEFRPPHLSSILFCSTAAKGVATRAHSQVQDVQLQLQESWIQRSEEHTSE